MKENNQKPFSQFNHECEEASPRYYAVQLLDYDIKAELTATQRTGIQRFTFPEDSLFVPQDIPGLIQKTGGKECFTQKLDSMFNWYPKRGDKSPIFSSGMIGQYVHGNEPSHHVTYLYDYMGIPSEIQRLVHEILTEQYKNEPKGHCGNGDCGQMFSWYIFSSPRFYLVNPAQGTYLLGAPLSEQAKIQLEDDKKFVVRTTIFSPENQFVANIKLKYITHK
ncbi:glycoside hydrolase domain-containing protein [Autumnicola musiva]|uniref:Glycoside hydrolase family 92 protein n=1 Tax=Autumnicola musiva TaxID=3075589 RepID=A0ABU3D210_9FLAO|nr:glycoside hydrolase domain-containing protein [Zunongwangia sp. F117]MDT0675456.1 glycoside hydrolase family 92 protein [Zunongwangia sp. F117]